MSQPKETTESCLSWCRCALYIPVAFASQWLMCAITIMRNMWLLFNNTRRRSMMMDDRLAGSMQKVHFTFVLCFGRITEESVKSLACAERAVFCISCQTCLTRRGQVEWTCLASQRCGTSCSGGGRSFSSMTETAQALSVAWSSSKVSPFVCV